MKNYRFTNYLQDKKYYWQTKRSLKKLADNNAIRTDMSRSFFGEQNLQSQLLWQSFKGMPYQLVAALTFIAVFEVASGISQHIFEVNLVVDRENKNTLVQLLTALVTVLGVVLGLYFTALSAAAGNLFLRAPASLQRLFLSNREGRQYVKTLVLATLIGVLYLLYMSAGYSVSILGPIGLVIICVYVVMRFMTIGGRAFYFIHPIDASAKLQGDLHLAIAGVVFSRRSSKRTRLQFIHHSKALQTLQTFDKLVDFGIDPVKLSGQQLVGIAEYIGGSVQYYLTQRNKIPTDSLWFTTKNKHQKWLISDESSLVVALNTGTNLRPNSVRHMEWFEETALRIILKVLRHLIGARDWSSAQACVEILVVLAADSGRLLLKPSNGLIVDKTIETISEALAEIDGDGTDEDTEGMLSLYEGIGRLPTAALLGLLKDIHKLSAKQLVERLDAIKWHKSGNFYSHNLPAPVILELEKVQSSLDNEKPIEDKIISPGWYLRTLALHHYLSAVKTYYEHIKAYDEIYKNHAQELKTKKQYLPSACIASCSLEYASKLVSLGQEVARLIKEAEDFHGVQDLKWTEIDPDVEKKTVNNIYDDSVDRMTELIAPLLLIPKENRDGFPDYLGQAIVFGMWAVYDAARTNDATRLRQVFPNILIGALGSRDAISKDVQGWLLDSQIILISEPFEDILSLSGFVKIYSELHDNEELWKVCEDTWSNFLVSPGVDAAQTITMLASAMSFRDSQHTISPRAGLRSNWDIKLRRTLEEMGISTDMYPSPFETQTDTSTHDSPLVRLVARRAGLLSFDARTVFLSLYLSKHPSVQDADISFPDRRDFERTYENEIGRYDDQEETDE
jgi:hypothetical protein